MDIDIGGIEVASFDLYGDPAVNNVSFKQTGIVISEGGLKDLVVRVDGKNALSTDHYFVVLFGHLYRTD